MDTTEHLRAAELQSIRSAVRDGNPDHARKQLSERGKAQELIRQQYSGRYPFELLQNANDATKESSLDEGRSAYFLLTDSALIVADNGAGFGDRQIRSICSLGDSSKGPGTAIGHKGLGFMSVGEITARPQIVSTGGEFQFDGERVREEVERILGALPGSQRFPVYAFPFPLSAGDLGEDADEIQRLRGEGYTTVIRLPLTEKMARETVEGHLLEHLFPSLLLFLPSIQTIELHGTSGDFVATIVHQRDGVAWSALLEYGNQFEQWLIYRHRFSPARELLEPLGEGWIDVEAIQVSIGVPLDEAGQPKTEMPYPLSVYFPTEAFAGLRASIHAEWVLTLDRKHVADTPEARLLNDAILDEVANFVADTYAIDLVKRFEFSRPAVHFLTPGLNTLVSPGAGSGLRERWIGALARSAFIPTAGGTLRSPAALRMLPSAIPDAAAAHRFVDIDPNTMLRPDLEGVRAVRHLIKGLAKDAELSADEFVSHLHAVEPDELTDYYKFLLACREAMGDVFTRALAKVRCVPTAHGEWLAPGQTPVFLPRSRGEASIPEGIPVPIAVLPDDSHDLDKFLEALGVKPFQWRTIIENYLMHVLRDPDADDGLRRQALASLEAYNQQRVGEAVPAVLADVLLPARSSDGAQREQLRRSGDLYFGSSWTESTDLEVLYGPFSQAEFLDVEPPQDADQKEEAVGFYEMLGVVGHPRIDSETSNHTGWTHPHSRDPAFSQWWSQPRTQELAGGCQMGHSASQRLNKSYRLDRLPEILDSKDWRRLMTLWRQLALHWDLYKPAMTATFHCIASVSHAGPRDRTTDSLLAYTLRSRAWVPVRRGDADELSVPQDAWYEAPDTPRGIRVHLPLISDDLRQLKGGTMLAADLGLTDVARPRIDDLLTLLGRLSIDADEVGEVSNEIAYAARWVQRRINDNLHRDSQPHSAPETVRLLTSEHGVKAFVAQPAYAVDRLMREAWEEREPVLVADNQPSRLANYLTLVDLDEAVDTIPDAVIGDYQRGSEPDRWVRERIDARKPHTLALIRAEHPGSDERAERALRWLEVVVCEELALRYKRGEIEIPRPAAPCFIDTRVQRVGSVNRRIGTAYLRLEPGIRPQPDWHAFSSQLAEFLGVPTLSDAIAMIFTTTGENRDSMLAQHSVEPVDVADARRRLDLPEELDEEQTGILNRLLPTSPGFDLPVAPAANSATGTTVSTPAPGPGAVGQATPTPPVTSEPPEPIVVIPLAPPAVDVSKVEMIDAKPGAIVSPVPSKPSTGGYGGGGASSAPTAAENQRNRDVGKHGERLAYQKERERLVEAGLDPAQVKWESEHNELAPYDISSVEGGQVIYIEVKSTTSSDPRDAFVISYNEIVLAGVHRDRYFIYRVTDTLGETPTITRFRDPFGLILDKRGEMRLRNATMSLTVGAEDEGTHGMG
ncbi:DUF3883 domain-containing protein [Cellulomonas sp. PhB150]|uniref:DUF3883 domain-containing protein n=1 Tax=Cellulomonas sp. PhB150 TaxID=2485188 RepID=UPI000F48AB3B|nr:DUF3883 domain-containing protein [Cellulomonas sp. PhB150]ROS27826.1 uncharacterized protein DUF3883 [Cellulomonas sp. PhB150]